MANIEKHNAKIIVEAQNEFERDSSHRFAVEQYVSNGYRSHFHRNIEIYGVVKGAVHITISGKDKLLQEGQIAVVRSMQSHAYIIDGEAEIFYAHIGTAYMREFYSMYPGQNLPQWLDDVSYNSLIYAHMQSLINKDTSQMSHLRRISWVYELLSDIIEHYGIENDNQFTTDNQNVVTAVIQYVYDHFTEPLSLESLGGGVWFFA